MNHRQQHSLSAVGQLSIVDLSSTKPICRWKIRRRPYLTAPRPGTGGGYLTADDVKKTAMMEVLKEALFAEVKGQQLYAHAASTTTDPAVKAIFKSLAKDEEAHVQVLKAQAKSLFEGGTFDLGAMSPTEVGGGSHTIIDDDFKKSLQRGTFEMAVIGIGCDLEKKAIAYYSEHAEKTDDPDLKQLFTWLSKWEEGHLSQLLDLEKFYKDAYWAEQGFMQM